jgi:hypothetical protein
MSAFVLLSSIIRKVEKSIQSNGTMANVSLIQTIVHTEIEKKDITAGAHLLSEILFCSSLRLIFIPY